MMKKNAKIYVAGHRGMVGERISVGLTRQNWKTDCACLMRTS